MLKQAAARDEQEAVSEPAPIERALFREDADGSTLFFPWGLAHRGYRIPDDAARARATRAVSLLVGTTLAVGTWTAYALQPVLEDDGGPGAVLEAVALPSAAFAFALFAYWLWASRFIEHLPESDLRVSRETRLQEAAALVSPWRLAAVGGITAAMSGLLLWLQPNGWWLAAAGALLGLGLVAWSVALARAGQATPRQPRPIDPSLEKP